MATQVWYHGPFCTDGFGAALAAWFKFGDSATYIPVNYGGEPPAVSPGDFIYIVDFSYPLDVLVKLQETCTVLVIDHHKTAMDDLSSFSNAIFNTQKSGAVLAWEYFHSELAVPEFFLYLQDRDLWRKELPGTEEFFAAIQAKNYGTEVYPKTFEVWHRLMERPVSELIEEGRKPLAERQKKVAQMAQEFIWLEIAGHKVPAASAPFYYSDVANLLCQRFPDAPFAACWRYDKELNCRRWDLRSLDNGLDVSEVAKLFGGGGHPHAAGYKEEL